MLANPVCQARTRSDVLTPSRASALLQWTCRAQWTSGFQWTCGVHMIWTDAKFVGAGLLAKAGCQARTRSDVLTPSRASALLQWIYGTHWTCGVHIIWTDAKFVGAGLLANSVCQARTRSDVLTPSRASALLQWTCRAQWTSGFQWTYGVHMTRTDAKFAGAGLLANPVCQITPDFLSRPC